MLTRIRGCGISGQKSHSPWAGAAPAPRGVAGSLNGTQLIENPDFKKHLAMWLGKLPDYPLTNEHSEQLRYYEPVCTGN
jgi:hypothetical protein